MGEVTASAGEAPVKIVSWNINGIRAVVRKGVLHQLVAIYNPDVICLQETRQAGQITLDLPEYPYHYWNGADKSGYAGTAILSKTAPLSVRPHIGVDCHDHEGRGDCCGISQFLCGLRVRPERQTDLSRLADRQDWDGCFLAHLKTLERDKPVVCGGEQRCYTPIDLASAEGKRQDTRLYSRRTGRLPVLHGTPDFIDTFRHLHPDQPVTTPGGASSETRERNVGWRIDYLLISAALLPCLTSATILSEVYGSDHCPVAIEPRAGGPSAPSEPCHACLYHGCNLTPQAVRCTYCGLPPLVRQRSLRQHGSTAEPMTSTIHASANRSSPRPLAAV